jgi:hypothetical protein
VLQHYDIDVAGLRLATPRDPRDLQSIFLQQSGRYPSSEIKSYSTSANKPNRATITLVCRITGYPAKLHRSW